MLLKGYVEGSWMCEHVKPIGSKATCSLAVGSTVLAAPTRHAAYDFFSPSAFNDT